MKTKSKNSRQSGGNHQPSYRTISGKRMVVLEEAEYCRLCRKADEWEPLLPEPLANGNYPAREYMAASIARDILRARRRVGLTQVDLARRAGIRPETLNRIEHGKHSPSIATMEKLDKALKKVEREQRE